MNIGKIYKTKIKSACCNAVVYSYNEDGELKYKCSKCLKSHEGQACINKKIKVVSKKTKKR